MMVIEGQPELANSAPAEQALQVLQNAKWDALHRDQLEFSH